MNLIQKILLGILTIGILTFLLFVTFITNNISVLDEPIYENTKLGLFELNKNSDNIFTVDDLTKLNNKNKTFIEKIDISDKVIFGSGSIKTETASGNVIISITPGIYFFDLKEINSNYIIKGIGFELNNKGPGSFFINTLDAKKNIVFSLDTLLDLNLKQYKTNENITNIYLYPHSYLIFNPVKNIFVKNSDLLKVSQTFNLGYYSEKIIINNEISEKFVDLISIKNEQSKDIVKNSISFIKQEYGLGTENINKFIDSTFGVIPGENFINKYSTLFINPNKKSLYYKNIIIRNLHDLLLNDKYDNETNNLIISNIKILENIDENSAKEIKNIITYYYGTVIKSDRSLETKINFSELISKINNVEIKGSLKSFLYLEKIFFEYDYLENSNFYNEIATFREKYFNDLNIDIKGNNTSKLSIDDMEKVDYLLFFLENLLISSDFGSSNIDTNNIITLFSDYVDISNSFYLSSDEKIKRTGIFTNSKILNKFVIILEEKYFNKDRNENLLLELKNNSNIVKDDILLLEGNINKIFLFYNNYKLVLKEDENNKDKFIINQYSVLNDKYEEYFSALKNYKEYLVKYDKSKKDLLTTKTVNEKNDTLVLSLENAYNYLKDFNGIDLSNVNIRIMDYNYCLNPTKENEEITLELPYCYKIENINIDSQEIYFLLHPFEKNKIDEIVINNVVKAGSYKLDEIKIVLDEKIKTETIDKDKYDFRNFLISSFGQKIIQENNNEQVIDTNNTNLQEDDVIKIFKRNKLLGETGDFANLGGFLDISYNNLIVKKVNNEYLININTGIFNILLGNNDTFYGEFKSEYNFSPDHSFINPELKLQDKKNKKDLLLGNYIYINGQYKVNNLKEEIKSVFELYDKISFIVNNSSQILKESTIKITYIKETNIITFEIPHNGGDIYLKLDKGNITEAKYNGKNILQYVTPYTNINLILNNIIK